MEPVPRYTKRNAPRPAMTMTATMIRTMKILGSFRFGLTGVISGPDVPEGTGSTCGSVDCILASSRLRRYGRFSYRSVLGHACHSRTRARTIAHQTEQTRPVDDGAAGTALLLESGCQSSAPRSIRRAGSCKAEAANVEPNTHFRAGGGSEAEPIRPTAPGPHVCLR